MALAKCPRSGKLFDNSQGVVHPECMKEEQEDYHKVQDYLAENPSSSIKEIEESTGVDKGCILRMVDQGIIEPFEADMEKDLVRQKQMARMDNQLAKEIAMIKLPKKRDVTFDGTVPSMLRKKLRD